MLEPPRVMDLSGGREEDAGEDIEGDEGHEERMEGGDRAEGVGTPLREEETKEVVEHISIWIKVKGTIYASDSILILI